MGSETDPPPEDFNASIEGAEQHDVGRCGYDWPANRLTDYDMRRLAMLANTTGRPMNQLIREAVEEYTTKLLDDGSRDPQLSDGRLEGRELARLMAIHRMTIVRLSMHMQITQKRIREVLNSELRDRNAIRDWLEAVTGVDPGRFWE